MIKNIKCMWTKIKINSSQLYNQIGRVINLERMPSLHYVKPVHAGLALALAAGIAILGLSFPGKGAPEKAAAQLRVQSDKKDNEIKERQLFRPEAGPTVSRGGVSHSDRYLLARVIEGEAADEPLKGKVAVGAVILNRTESKDFPQGISQVVYQPLAFEAVSNGQYNRPLTPEALKAADLALEGNDPTNGALYYWNPAKATSGWVWQRPVTMQIGRHVFAR